MEHVSLFKRTHSLQTSHLSRYVPRKKVLQHDPKGLILGLVAGFFLSYLGHPLVNVSVVMTPNGPLLVLFVLKWFLPHSFVQHGPSCWVGSLHYTSQSWEAEWFHHMLADSKNHRGSQYVCMCSKQQTVRVFGNLVGSACGCSEFNSHKYTSWWGASMGQKILKCFNGQFWEIFN